MPEECLGRTCMVQVVQGEKALRERTITIDSVALKRKYILLH